MRISTKTSGELHAKEIDQIAKLAGIGFGSGTTDEMYEDTVQHVEASDFIQLAHDDGKLRGFSMVRGCLWRTRA